MWMGFSDVEITLLMKLYHHNYIGHRHTEFRNAVKGFPHDMEVGVKGALKRLIREGLIMQHPSTDEIHVSLNHRRIAEIRKIIGED